LSVSAPDTRPRPSIENIKIDRTIARNVLDAMPVGNVPDKRLCGLVVHRRFSKRGELLNCRPA
jgi:hypothetical protein